MNKQFGKLATTALWTLIIAVVTIFVLRNIRHQWTIRSMDMVRNNMSNQIDIQNDLMLIDISWWVALFLGISFTLLVWYLAYGKNLKKYLGFGSIAVMALFMSGCSQQFVTVTPPNYAITINMNEKTDQAVGNDFGNGELVNVTRITILTPFCARFRSPTRCPDKLVAEVEGAPVSRQYTRDPNTGTSGADEAICFEASGVNGCVDFSVSAIIKREDAKCYANKVGVRPVEGTNYYFKAISLAEALDTRLVQIASAMMVAETATSNPLDLAVTKFTTFAKLKDGIIDEVYDQTCITVNRLELSGGIKWDSIEVQATIDDAIVLENMVTLEERRRDLQDRQVANLKARVDAYAHDYGQDAALYLIAVEQWDGSFMPSQWMTSISTEDLQEPASISASDLITEAVDKE